MNNDDINLSDSNVSNGSLYDDNYSELNIDPYANVTLSKKSKIKDISNYLTDNNPNIFNNDSKKLKSNNNNNKIECNYNNNRDKIDDLLYIINGLNINQSNDIKINSLYKIIIQYMMNDQNLLLIKSNNIYNDIFDKLYQNINTYTNDYQMIILIFIYLCITNNELKTCIYNNKKIIEIVFHCLTNYVKHDNINHIRRRR